jgi:ParB-like chromosome segregation protein Spo0J
MKLIDKIELIPIEKIMPYHNNPKEHPPEQIKKIASSIKEFGFLVPVIVNKDYGLVAGHGRYEAAKLIGMDKVPGIKAEHLTDAQIKQFRLVDNKIAESEWNMTSLAMELRNIDGFTGFDDNEKEKILEINEIEMVNLDELLNDVNIEESIENPDWVTMRFDREFRNEIEKIINKIQNAKVEKSYE